MARIEWDEKLVLFDQCFYCLLITVQKHKTEQGTSISTKMQILVAYFAGSVTDCFSSWHIRKREE